MSNMLASSNALYFHGPAPWFTVREKHASAPLQTKNLCTPMNNRYSHSPPQVVPAPVAPFPRSLPSTHRICSHSSTMQTKMETGATLMGAAMGYSRSHILDTSVLEGGGRRRGPGQSCMLLTRRPCILVSGHRHLPLNPCMLLLRNRRLPPAPQCHPLPVYLMRLVTLPLDIVWRTLAPSLRHFWYTAQVSCVRSATCTWIICS